MNPPIISKGYRVDLSRIQEGFLYSEFSIQADSWNQARHKLVLMTAYEDMKLINGDVVTYWNIPVVRSKVNDIVLFEGKHYERYVLDTFIREQERRSKLKELCDQHEYFYIMKRGLYYPQSCAGYTSVKELAGVFTSKQALSHALGCDELTIVPINIAEHNQMLLNVQTRIIVN